MSMFTLEEKLKPEVLPRFDEIEVLYRELDKMRSHQLESVTSGEDVPTRSEESYDKSREELVRQVSQVRLHNNRIEELVTQLRQLNQRLTTLDGQLLRMAEGSKVAREEFLKYYHGFELDPSWVARVSVLPGKGWKPFVTKHATDITVITCAARSPPSRPMPAFRSPNSAGSI